MRVARADALQMIAALKDAALDISPLCEANPALYKVLYTALIGLAGVIERQLGDEMAVNLDDKLGPLLAMSLELIQEPPSQAEIDEKLALVLQTLRSRLPKPH